MYSLYSQTNHIKDIFISKKSWLFWKRKMCSTFIFEANGIESKTQIWPGTKRFNQTKHNTCDPCVCLLEVCRTGTFIRNFQATVICETCHCWHFQTVCKQFTCKLLSCIRPLIKCSISPSLLGLWHGSSSSQVSILLGTEGSLIENGTIKLSTENMNFWAEALSSFCKWRKSKSKWERLRSCEANKTFISSWNNSL